jgi:hypothetical protein
MNSINVSAKQLRRAAEIKDKIEALEKELSTILGNSPAAAPAAPAASSRKRTISAAGRARIAAAARARWARVRAEKKK